MKTAAGRLCWALLKFVGTQARYDMIDVETV